MRKLLSVLLIFLIFSCTEAGTTYVKLNGDEVNLPPELKGLKVYKVYIDKDIYINVALLNNSLNSLNYQVNKKNFNVIILKNNRIMEYSEIVSETENFIILKK